MDSLVRNTTTADQAQKLEDSELNYLREGTPKHSAAYFGILATRRKLPVYGQHQAFLDIYQKAQVMVLSSDTGSGKTTQIPQFVLYDEYADGKMIACTQPRRLAVSSVARRVAEELDVTLGEEVGFNVRFENVTSDRTRLKYMTEGILLSEAKNDPSFSKYSCIIIDEAHERTMNTDVIMATLKEALGRRNDLKVVVMSATLDAHKFQTYFKGAPHLHIPGRAHPVEIQYLEEDEPNYLLACCRTAKNIHRNMPEGDILIFLPGEHDIELACALLTREVEGLEVLPLYSTISSAKQKQIFKSSSARKCICATNIVETRLTIDGIVYVVDVGLAKRMTYNPRVRMDVLQTAPISQAAARQRAGRAGRTRPGKCFRMYTVEGFNKLLLPASSPGILMSEIKSVILTLKMAGHHDLLKFDFIDPPAPETLLRGAEELYHLGYLTDTGVITQAGKHAMKLPVDPIWYNVIMKGVENNVGFDMITIAALFSTQKSIFLRPHAYRHVADSASAQFTHPLSDHITHLNALHEYVRASNKNKTDMDQWCFDHFLDRTTLEEVLKIRIQLIAAISVQLNSTPFGDEYHTNIRKALALGLFNQTAMKQKKGDDVYRTIHGNQPALLHPNSALVGASHEWVVYHVFRMTSKQYLETVTVIEPEWIADLPYFNDSEMPIKPKTGEPKQIAVKQSLEKARLRLSQGL